MSSSTSDQQTEHTDGKLATESAPPGMNSITNTVGMQPTINHTSSSSNVASSARRGSCDHPGCTGEHSGKVHE